MCIVPLSLRKSRIASSFIVICNSYSYTWFELEQSLSPFGDDLLQAAVMLGWTMESWDNIKSSENQVPESECKDWTDLHPDERWALRAFGWSSNKWMSYPAGKLFTVKLSLTMMLSFHHDLNIFYFWMFTCTKWPWLDPRCPEDDPPFTLNN